MVQAATANDEFSISIAGGDIDRAAESVREYLRSEFGKEYPDWVIAGALRAWLERRAEQIGEELAEVLTEPGRPEAVEFRRLLTSTLENVVSLDRELQDEPAEANVFTGNRHFSAEKLAAMAAYIAARGKEIYKTKLNKLLFYSDFVNYYLRGTSISGSRYVHLPFGPVPDGYEILLSNLTEAGTIEIKDRFGSELIKAADADAAAGVLSGEERETIDWILENYGPLSAAAISELSHREMAYRFTRTGEEIAYDYAKFFVKLPDRGLRS